MTKLIELTQGQWALVDEEDFEDLVRYKWQAAYDPRTGSYYAVHWLGRKCTPRAEKMHRRILGLRFGDGLQVDHINHDTLDNRRSNLKAVTSRQNHENLRRQSKLGVGVSLEPRCITNRFKAYAWLGNKQHHIGAFPTPMEARLARKIFLESHGNELGSSSSSPSSSSSSQGP